MADDFDIDAFNAEHGAAPAGPFVRGKTPTKRIAAPETGPGKTIPADDFDVDAVSPRQNMGPNARRAAAGRPPEPGAPAYLEPDSIDMRDVEHERRMTENNPFAGDPLARAVATGVVGMGAGTLVGGIATAAGVPQLLTRALAGGAAGATSAAGAGDNPAIGAATGAAIPLVADVAKLMRGEIGSAAQQLFRRIGQASEAGDQVALEKIGQKRFSEILEKHGAADIQDPRAAVDAAKANVEGELRAAQQAASDKVKTDAAAAFDALPADEKLFRQVGQLAGKTNAPAVDRLGKTAVAGALDRAGVKSLDNVQQAAAAITAARAATGKNIGAAYDVFDATGSGAKLSDAMNALDSYRGSLEESTATKPLADAVRKFMKSFWDTHGGDADKVISLKTLNQEIGALQKAGFSAPGVELSQTSNAQLGRGAAKALDGVLEKQIGEAAKASPAAAEAAKNLKTWNQDFRVFTTLQKPIAGRAAALRFATPEVPPVPTPPKLDLAKLAQSHGPLVEELRALNITSNAMARMQAAKMFPPGVSSMGKTPGEVASALFAKAAGVPVRAAAAPFSAADAAIARLFMAKASGTVTPELIKAAAAAGVSADTLRHFVAHSGHPTMTSP
jgi:hypothetical protein